MFFGNSRALQQYLFSLLQSCKTSKELSQIHTQIVVNGFCQKNYILAKLLSFCVTFGNLIHAQRAFDQIDNPSTTLWNHMIRGYARSEKPWKSVQVYNQMEGTEAEPDEFTYSFLLVACARLQLLKEGEQIHDRVMLKGFCSNVFVQTNLVNMYAMAGGDIGVEIARQVFDEITHRNIVTWNSMLAGYLRSGNIDKAFRTFDDMPEKNVVSWTTMVAGCAQHGRFKQALLLFSKMRRIDMGIDQVALVAALSACAKLGNLSLGRWIHSYIKEASEPRIVSLDNALINMYASCGLIKEAYRVFKEMPKRSTVSWTSMIMGFAKQGCGEEAIIIFQWMQSVGGAEGGVRPDEVTLIGVLYACSHTGLVDEGRRFFKCMNQAWGIEPRIEHYGCMVDLLSRAGLLDEAHELVETMPVKPNDVVWGALLGGCRIHKDVKLATHLAQKLAVELEPERAAGYLVLLSNLYAAEKRWLDVATVRKKMVEISARKPPGRSWVQVDGVIHDFVAGDATHRHASTIFETVDKITRHSKWKADELNVSMGSQTLEYEI